MKRQRRRSACPCDSGHCRKLLQCLIEKCRPLLGRAPCQLNFQRERFVRGEPRIHLEQCRETTREQPGADKQHESDSDLSDNQCPTKVLSRAPGCCRVGTLFQHVLQIEAGLLKGRGQTE